MPTVAQEIERLRSLGYDNPEAFVAKRIGVDPSQLTPQMRAVDVGALFPMLQNPLVPRDLGPQPQQAPAQVPVGLPEAAVPEPQQSPEAFGEAKLNQRTAGERAMNALALASMSAIPVAAGALYGVGKEVGRGAARLVGQEEAYKQALANLPGPLRENPNEDPTLREREAYRQVLEDRRTKDWPETLAESSADVFRGFMSPAVEVTGISPTGFEHLPLYEQFLPSMMMRFQRGRQFGEGGVIGPGVQAAELVDNPTQALSGDPAGYALTLLPAAKGAFSAARAARARLPGGNRPIGAPAGFAEERVTVPSTAPAGAETAAVLGDTAEAVRRTGTETRASTEAVRNAEARVAEGQAVTSTPRPAQGTLSRIVESAPGVINNAVLGGGALAMAGASTGMAGAGAVLGASLPIAIRAIIERSRSAQAGGALGSAITKAKQLGIESTYHPSPEGGQILSSTLVDPQRLRSATEAEMQSAINRTRGMEPVPDTQARGESPRYDLQRRRLLETGDVVDAPLDSAGYSEGSMASTGAAIETRGLQGQRDLVSNAIARTKQSLKRADERLTEFDYVDIDDAKRRLGEVSAAIENTKAVASEYGKVERQRERVAGMRDQLERKTRATTENEAVAGRYDAELADATAKHEGVVADLESRRQQLTQTLADAETKAQSILDADPAAGQKNKRGQRLTQAQKDYRAAAKDADQARQRLAGIDPALESAKAGYERQRSYLTDKRNAAAESEATRAAEATAKYKDSIAKIEQVLAKAEAELAERVATLPPELQREGADFKAWLNERYKRRGELKGMVGLEDVRKRADFLQEQLTSFEAKREQIRARLAEIDAERRAGKYPSSSEALSKYAGAVKDEPRVFMRDGKPLTYVNAEGVEVPVRRWVPLDDPHLNATAERMYQRANSKRAPGVPEIPRQYFQRLLMDAMFDDSPMLAGSKAIRGAVAKKVAERLGFKKGDTSRARRMVEEAVQKELDETASSALRTGGAGERPVWTELEVQGQKFNLRQLSAEAAAEFSNRNVKWWQGRRNKSLRDVAVQQAAERASRAMGLKVEEASFAQSVYNEAARDVPADAVTPYDRAAFVFADKAAKGERPRSAVDFDPVPVARQILADPLAFVQHVERATGVKIPDTGGGASLAAQQFANELLRFKPANDALTAILRSAEQQSHIPKGGRVFLHGDFSLPINNHASAIRIHAGLNGLETKLQRFSQHAKGMMTYGNIGVHLFNKLSNAAVRSIMDPFAELGSELHDIKVARRWAKWVREGSVEGKPIRVGAVEVTPNEVMRALADTGAVDTSMISDLARNIGQGDSSLGRVASTVRGAKDVARKSYIAGDSLQKIGETEKFMGNVLQNLNELEPGREVALDLGNRTSITLRNEGGVIVNATTGVPLTGEQLAHYAAKAGFESPKSYLFDFNNLPVVLSTLSRIPIVSVVQPFMSWMWKAVDIPGVKPGIGTAILKYDPTFTLKTNSPRLHQKRVLAMAKLMAKRAAFLGVARSMYDFGDIAGNIAAQTNKAMPPAVLAYTTDTDVEDALLPFYSAFAMGPTIGMMRAGSAVLGAMVGNRWEDRMDPAVADENMSDAERRRKAAVRRWWSNWNTGRVGTMKDVLAFTGVSGAMVGKLLDYADEKERRQEPVEWTEMLPAAMALTVAGSAIDAARVISSLGTSESEFAQWRDVAGADRETLYGAASRMPGKEDWVRYAVRTIFGLAIQTRATTEMTGRDLDEFSKTLVRNVIDNRIKSVVADYFKLVSLQRQQAPGYANKQTNADQNRMQQLALSLEAEGGVDRQAVLAEMQEIVARSGDASAAAAMQQKINDSIKIVNVVKAELQARAAKFLQINERRKYLLSREATRRQRALGQETP